MVSQITLAQAVSCSGIGLHSGDAVHMVLHPAEAGEGIVFRRKDISGKAGFVPARYNLVEGTRLGTTLVNARGTRVSTVEHLMAALWGMGVDNALIELSAGEVPIMDGSSAPFIALIEQAGLRRQNAPRKVLRVLKEVEIRQGASCARVAPFEGEDYGCLLDVTIDFAHSAVARSRAVYEFPGDSFAQGLAAARTFGFAQEVEYLRSQGLARGGSLENAVVIGEEGVLNAEGLRFSDEFLRHKALDCIGDLYLAGVRIEGAFTFERPGHGVNNALLRTLFADKSAWRIVSAAAEQPGTAAQHYAFA